MGRLAVTNYDTISSPLCHPRWQHTTTLLYSHPSSSQCLVALAHQNMSKREPGDMARLYSSELSSSSGSGEECHVLIHCLPGRAPIVSFAPFVSRPRGSTPPYCCCCTQMEYKASIKIFALLSEVVVVGVRRAINTVVLTEYIPDARLLHQYCLCIAIDSTDCFAHLGDRHWSARGLVAVSGRERHLDSFRLALTASNQLAAFCDLLTVCDLLHFYHSCTFAIALYRGSISRGLNSIILIWYLRPH